MKRVERHEISHKGDQYTFIGMSASAKAIISYRTGKRDSENTDLFIQDLRERVPTSNFFQRNGYERNPVAVRNNTVAKLLAVTDERMDSNSTKPGAKELAASF